MAEEGREPLVEPRRHLRLAKIGVDDRVDVLVKNDLVRLSLFAADRYVLPDQIASVSGSRITLCVTRDELIIHRGG